MCSLAYLFDRNTFRMCKCFTNFWVFKFVLPAMIFQKCIYDLGSDRTLITSFIELQRVYNITDVGPISNFAIFYDFLVTINIFHIGSLKTAFTFCDVELLCFC